MSKGVGALLEWTGHYLDQLGDAMVAPAAPQTPGAKVHIYTYILVYIFSTTWHIAPLNSEAVVVRGICAKYRPRSNSLLPSSLDDHWTAAHRRLVHPAWGIPLVRSQNALELHIATGTMGTMGTMVLCRRFPQSLHRYTSKS